MVRYEFLSIQSVKPVFPSRSHMRRSISISEMVSCGESENLRLSASMMPFSAIMPLPPNTTSVDDSPGPADA